MIAQVRAGIPYVKPHSNWDGNDCSGSIVLALQDILGIKFINPDPTAERFKDIAVLKMASTYYVDQSYTPKGSRIDFYQPVSTANLFLMTWEVKAVVWGALDPSEQALYGNRVFHISLLVKRGRRWYHIMQSSYNVSGGIEVHDLEFHYSDILSLTESVDYEDIVATFLPIKDLHVWDALYSSRNYIPAPEPKVVIPKDPSSMDTWKDEEDIDLKVDPLIKERYWRLLFSSRWSQAIRLLGSNVYDSILEWDGTSWVGYGGGTEGDTGALRSGSPS
jgi:hypothetical protein